MTLIGFALWKRTPKLELTDEQRHVFATLPVLKSSNDDQVDTSISGDLIKSNAGNVLYLHCLTTKGNWFGKTIPDSDLYLPLVVPKEISFQVSITAWMNYDTTTTSGQVTGPEQEFRTHNPSCENIAQVSINHGWSLPADAQIISYRPII